MPLSFHCSIAAKIDDASNDPLPGSAFSWRFADRSAVPLSDIRRGAVELQ